MNVQFKEWECEVVFSKYANTGNSAMILYGADGTDYSEDYIATATVNGQLKKTEDVVGIKDWSENEGMTEALIKAGVIESAPVDMEPSGFVLIHYYKLTPKAYKELKKQSAATDC